MISAIGHDYCRVIISLIRNVAVLTKIWLGLHISVKRGWETWRRADKLLFVPASAEAATRAEGAIFFNTSHAHGPLDIGGPSRVRDNLARGRRIMNLEKKSEP